MQDTQISCFITAKNRYLKSSEYFCTDITVTSTCFLIRALFMLSQTNICCKLLRMMTKLYLFKSCDHMFQGKVSIVLPDHYNILKHICTMATYLDNTTSFSYKQYSQKYNNAQQCYNFPTVAKFSMKVNQILKLIIKYFSCLYYFLESYTRRINYRVV